MLILKYYLLIITFKTIETNQILFECTFDTNELCGLQSSDGGEQMIIHEGNQISIFDKPIQPSSDVSSIYQLTTNGYQCQIPYRKESNENEFYFCSKSSNITNDKKCILINGLEDECQQGKHQLLLLKNDSKREFSSPEFNVYSNFSCLTFYYYLTKADQYYLLTYSLSYQGEKKLIGIYSDVPFNGWHLASHSFQTNSKSYKIMFTILMSNRSDSDPFYVAFDQITVREGDCESILSDDQKFFDDTSTDSIDYSRETYAVNRDSTNYQDTKSTEYKEELISSNSDTTFIYQTTDFLRNISSSTNQANNGSQTPPKSDLQYSFKTVLALSIGLGIPAGLGVIGGFIYLYKLIEQRKSQVIPIKHSNRKRHHDKTQIPLKKTRHHHHHKKREDIV